MLWKAALPNSRNRSSKHQCRVEWAKIPKAERPLIETLVSALKTWNRSAAWRQDSNAYVPGLHRFIQRRLWEDLPEVMEAGSRYRHAPIIQPARDGSGEVTDAAEIASLLSLKPVTKR
jgi:hypothetical protein